MKKLLSMILAIVMVLALGTTAFAANPDETGSITINEAQIGETYTIWKMFDVESFKDTDSDKVYENYVYTIDATSPWYNFVLNAKHSYTTGEGEGAETVGKPLFVLTATTSDETPAKYYVTEYKEYDTDGNETFAHTADAWTEFAKDATDYAQAESTKINETASKVATNDSGETTVEPGEENTTTVKFEELELGYYLIDSTMGLLCALDSTEPNVTITEKNTAPVIDKNVLEDSTGEWATKNDADISQVVDYVTVVTVKNGAYKYEVHDKMTAGLTFNGSVKVYVLDKAETLKKDEYDTLYEVASENYELVSPATCVWPTNEEENCDFVVKFNDEYMATLGTGDYLHIVYSATLNENAVEAIAETNDTYLKYGNSSVTAIVETETYTWDVDVLKYGDGDETNVLEGAEFVILKETKDVSGAVVKTEYAVIKEITEGEGENAVVTRRVINGWKIASEAMLDGTESFESAAILVTDENGKIVVDGLDADSYKLHEVKAPEGYNKLKADVDFTVVAGTKNESGTMVYEPATVKVNNQSGVELPSTGGMGTTIFYILGSIMTLGALVVLVARKRMGEAE